MALQGTDKFPIERAGALYSGDVAGILAYVRANLGTSEYSVADITARNALTGMTTGDIAYVVDATGDATVTAGWAVYMWQGASWSKISEQEGMVVSSTGTDATIPAATGAIAGLMVPPQVDKVGHLTVTAATNLDTMRNASHAAVTTAGAANTNPIVVTGQVLSFSISNLTAAP
jgi:hypothetical protein